MIHKIHFSFLFFAFLFLAGCFDQAQEVRLIESRETMEFLGNGRGIIVDVREKNETRSGIVENAEWLPLSTMEADPYMVDLFLKAKPKDKQLIFYCSSGGVRAEKAARIVAAKGWKSAYLRNTIGLPIKRTSF